MALGSHRIGEVWVFDEENRHICLPCCYRIDPDLAETLENYYKKEKWGF